MKVKSIVFIAIVICLSGFQNANAQAIRFGNHEGIMTTNMKSDIGDFSGTLGEVESGEMGFGFMSGFFFRAEIKKVTIGTELNLQYYKGNFNTKLPQIDNAGNTLATLEDLEASYRFINIQVPVIVGIKISKLRIGAGPTWNKFLDVKQTIENRDDVDALKDYKSSYLGYQFGLGLDISRWSIDLKYDATTNFLAESDASVVSVLNKGSRSRTSVLLTFGYSLVKIK